MTEGGALPEGSGVDAERESIGENAQPEGQRLHIQGPIPCRAACLGYLLLASSPMPQSRVRQHLRQCTEIS